MAGTKYTFATTGPSTFDIDLSHSLMQSIKPTWNYLYDFTLFIGFSLFLTLECTGANSLGEPVYQGITYFSRSLQFFWRWHDFERCRRHLLHKSRLNSRSLATSLDHCCAHVCDIDFNVYKLHGDAHYVLPAAFEQCQWKKQDGRVSLWFY
jgi:hypothetical protein